MSELTVLALKFACLHKQVTEWVLCGHSPRHEDLADALVRGMAPCSLELEKAIRSAAAGRRAEPCVFGGSSSGELTASAPKSFEHFKRGYNSPGTEPRST